MEDNLANDLIKILDDCKLPKPVQQNILDKLVPYLTERDHKLLAHGREQGRADA